MDLITMIMACSLYPDNSTINAMVQLGSKNNPLSLSTSEPTGTVKTYSFKTDQAALSFATTKLAQGQRVDIGMMQIPSPWLSKFEHEYQFDLASLWRPCKNIAIATTILNQAGDQCQGSHIIDQKACALSVYKTGNLTDGLNYAQQVMHYAHAHPIIKTPPGDGSVAEHTSSSATEAADLVMSDDTANKVSSTDASPADSDDNDMFKLSTETSAAPIVEPPQPPQRQTDNQQTTALDDIQP